MIKEKNELKCFSSTISIKENDQVDCIMNNTCIFEDAYKKFYTCKQCRDSIGNKICEKCFYKCHRGHEQDSAPTEFHLNIREQHCNCAEAGHTKSIIEPDSETCCFKGLAENLKIDQLVELRSKINKKMLVVCYGCFIGCHYKQEEYEINFIKKDIFECGCIQCRIEQKSGEGNLITLFFHFHNEKVINLRKIFKNFVNAGKLKNDFEKEIIDALTGYRAMRSGLIEKFASVKIKMLLFKIGIKLSQGEEIKLFNKEQLIELCISNPRQKGVGMGRGRIGGGNQSSQQQQAEENVQLGFKAYYWYFLRNILIKPCLRNKSPWSKLSNLSNSTPFQRQIFREKFDSFYYRSKDNGLDLTFSRLHSILSLGRVAITTSTENLALFAIEYFKWCCIFASFDYRASEVLSKQEKKKLNTLMLRGVQSIITGLRKENVILNADNTSPTVFNNEKNILKYVEKFFKTYLIRFNDERFFDYMQDIKEIDKLMFFFEKRKKQKAEGREAQENRLCAFQGLFFTKGEEPIVSSECYELLLSYEDSYISNLQTLVTLQDNTIDKVLYDHFIKVSWNSSRVSNSVIDKDQIFSNVMNCINNYSNTDMSPAFFYDDIKMSLSLITEKMIVFTSIKKVTKKAIDQLKKIKEPYFGTLFTLYKLFNTDNFIKAEIEKEKIDYILKSILNLFRLFFDNPIILSFFFTPGSMKSISNPCSRRNQPILYFSQEQIQFYSEAIENSIKMNFPLDLNEFTKRLIEEKIAANKIEVEEVFSKGERSCEENEVLELCILKTDLMAKILQISSKESLMKVNHLIKNYLESMKYINLLQLSYFELEENQRQLYLNILKIVNSVNDYYYYLLSARFPINDIKFNLSELSDKLSDPEYSDEKLRIDTQLVIFTKAITRYYLISHFEVFPSSLKSVIKYENDQWALKQTINTRIIEEKSEDNGRSMMGIFSNNALSISGKNQLKEICDDFESKIELLISNLARFKTHFYCIENNEDELFSHFEEVILIPSVYIVYDIVAFFPSISSKAKYLVYKVINLFMQCYKFFVETIITYFLPENMRQLNMSIQKSKSFGGMMFSNQDKLLKIMQLLLDTFVIQRKNEDLKIFFQNIHDCLTNDITAIEKDPLNLKMLFTKFIKFVSGLKRGQFLNKINLSEAIFFDFHNKINTMEDVSEEISPELAEYKKKLSLFVNKYLEKKEDNENNVIIDFIEKKLESSAPILKIIIKDLIGKLYLEEGESVYNDRFFSVFDYFNKIFIANPLVFQEHILEFTTVEKQKDDLNQNINLDENQVLESKLLRSNKIINYVKSQLPLVYQLTFIDYYKLNSHLEPKYKAINIFVSLLEFLRLLCENHNQQFQMHLSSEYIKNEKFLFFIVQIPSLAKDHFEEYNSKKNFLVFFKLNSHEYFKPLIAKVIDFNIELIQGSKAGRKLILDEKSSFNFNNCFRIYINSASKAFEEFEEDANVFYLSQFYKFIVALMEEYSTKEKYKKDIINHFNLNKMVSFLVSCTQQLYSNLPNADQIPKNETEYSKYLIESYRNHNDYFINSDYFTIASLSLKYLTIANNIKSCNKVHEIINDITKERSTAVNDNYNNWKYECFKFFKKIMKTVEVSVKFEFLDEDNNIEDVNDKNTQDEDENDSNKAKEDLLQNIFLVHPDALLLSKEDYKKFMDKAPYEDDSIKLNHLIKYRKKLEDTIKIRTLTKQRSNLFETLSKIDYIDAVKISVVLASITALFVLFSSYYQTKINQTIDGIISETNSVRIERNEDWIFYIGLSHLIFLFSVMCNWVYFEGLLLSNTAKKRRIALQLVKKLFSNTPLFLILWNFLWGLLAVCFSYCHFGYSLQLFAIFGLFETMKTVVISVKMRYMQFLSAGLLIIIFSLFFAGVKFIWFCDDVAEECQQYLYCFLFLLTTGIRAGNGVGFAMKSISEPSYFTDFIIEWLFYFSVILILLNVINGIIVDTFQEQREKANEKSDARENLCYICNTNRSYFERNGQDYEYHITEEHSLINYFEYILTLLKRPEQSLNSIDYSIRKQLIDRQTNYFPSRKDKDSK